MIFGVGTDIVELARVQATYERFGEHFVRRILMPEELELFGRSKRPVRFLAMRFAGKEATVKAMGTGFAHGVWLRDVGILNDARGRPVVTWSERGSRVCRRLGVGAGHVSLSDDAGLVLAFAVVETLTPMASEQ
ncbi:MAG: holo-ACP synthase [Gammaproteobacteria bacterium]|nr:holo-ACP synthase [Gammaproteobacteria bacterium]